MLGTVTTLAGYYNSGGDDDSYYYYGGNGYTDGVGTNASFYFPYDLEINSAGYIYIADTANGVIRKMTTSGK